MKKFFTFLTVILIIYVVYIDLSIGTLPTSSSKERTKLTEASASSKINISSFQAEVKPGETVISIVEHKIDRSLPVPISELIDDFQALNPGNAAERIQVGATYHFPDYSKK